MALNLRTSSVQNMLRESNGSHCHNFIKDFIAHERSQIALQVFGNYAPFILASLLAFFLASNAGLRYWIAVQRTPTPYHSKEDTKRTRKTIAALVVIFAVDALGSYYIGRQFPAVRESRIYIITGCVLFASLNFLLINVSGIVSVAAHRGTTGRPELRTMKDRKMRVVLVWAIAINIAYDAVALREGVSLWLGLVSLIFCFARGTFSVRFDVIAYPFYFLSLIFSGTLIRVPREVSIQYLYRMSGKKPEHEWIYTWFMPCFFMAVPGIILSLMLRFDYQQHLEAHPEADQSDDLKVVGASATMGDFVNRVGNGVVLPLETPLKFRKTYFKTALTAWLMTQLFYLALCLITKKNEDNSVPVITYLFDFIPPAIQAVCIAVGVRALMKGEFRKLMAYKETWRTNPVPLPAIEITCHEEEDEKVKDVVLV